MNTHRHLVGPIGCIAANGSSVITAHGKPIAVFFVDGAYYAIDDTCPHMGASLAGGELENGIVACPWHYWRFRLADGVWADNPRIKIGCYPVVVENDRIYVEVAPPEPTGDATSHPLSPLP